MLRAASTRKLTYTHTHARARTHARTHTQTHTHSPSFSLNLPLLQGAKGKRVADSVEALLGVTFLASGGLQALHLSTPSPDADHAAHLSASNAPSFQHNLPGHHPNHRHQQSLHKPTSSASVPAPPAQVTDSIHWDPAALTHGMAGAAFLSECMGIMPKGVLESYKSGWLFKTEFAAMRLACLQRRCTTESISAFIMHCFMVSHRYCKHDAYNDSWMRF